GRFLTTSTRFGNTPAVAGALEYVADHEPMTIAILHGFVPNEGDAWRFTLDTLQAFFERALARGHDVPPRAASGGLVAAASQDPALAEELFASSLESAQVLGARTAALHAALASRRDIPAFAPEPFSALDQRALVQSLRTSQANTFRVLRPRVGDIPEATALLARQEDLLSKTRALLGSPIGGQRIRTHGDFHLGQVLYTGRDFLI